MEITKDQKEKVIKLIKEHAAENGSCRVGWAIKKEIGKDFEKSIHNIEKISNTIIKSNKYIKEPSAEVENDWNILINPNHKTIIFNRNTVILNIILTLIVILLTIIKLKQP